LECGVAEAEKVLAERLGFREEVDRANDRVKAMEGECAQFVERIAQQNQQLREAETTSASLQQKVAELGEKVEEQNGELLSLREYKAVHERFAEENRNLVAVKVDLFNCKQAIENLQSELLFGKQVEKNLEGEVLSLRSQLRESAVALQSVSDSKNELWDQLRQQKGVVDSLRGELGEREALVKLTETKCRFLEQRVKEAEREVKEREDRLHEAELRVAECGGEDPRLTIQTRMQEREVREYSLINRELQGQLSRALVEVRTLEKENGRLSEELKVMAESDVAVILQQGRDKDNQIMEMIKVTNERVDELGVARRELVESQQQVVQQQHRVGLLENRVAELLEKRREVGWMVAKFVEGGRRQLGVSEEQEGSLEELMMAYRKIEEQAGVIEAMEDSTGQSVSKHPLMKKKDMRISSLEQSLQSAQENWQFVERRNQRLAEEVVKQELAVEAKRSQVAKLDDEIAMLNSRNGELVFMVESLKGDSGEALEGKRQLEHQKELLKKEIDDLGQIHRVNALNLAVAQADLLIEQEKHRSMLGENQSLKEEVARLKEANMQLQEGLIDNTEGFFNKISELDDKVGELELMNARLETRNNEMQGVMEELRERGREQEAVAEGLRLKNEYLAKQNDKYSNMMGLPKDFVTKLTNYDDFIDKFNGLMEENVLKEQKVQSLENRLDRLLTKHPQLREESQGEEEKSHVSSDSDEHEAKKQTRFATAVDQKRPLFGEDESEGRLAEVSRRLERVESENKQLKHNLSFYLNPVKHTDAESGTHKGNFSNAQNTQSLMNELASKSRKIESFGLTMNRMHEDYRKLREHTNAVEEELKLKELELKGVREEQTPLHLQIAELRSAVEVKGMGEIKDVSEANVKLAQLLRDKDRHLREVLGQMEERVKAREQEVERLRALVGDSVKVKEELRRAREECGKLEAKLESARQSVTGQAELEGMRVIFIKLEGEVAELKQQLGAEKTLNAKQNTLLEAAETIARSREGDVKSLQASLASQKAIVDGLQQELTYYRKAIPIQEDLSDDAMLRKLQLKDNEIHRLKVTLQEQGKCLVEVQDQKRSLSEKEVQVKKLVAENNKLAAELVGKRKECEQLGKRVEDLATEQVIAKDRHQLVVGRLGKAVEALGLLEKSNQTLREQLREVVGLCNERNQETGDAIRNFDFEVQTLNQVVQDMKDRREGQKEH
jgi:chromosome segregation ATPase